MRKYAAVFIAEWEHQLTYRLNFFLWRLRNILRVLMTLFLWLGLFRTNTHPIITYVFLVLLIQSFILSSPSGDHVGGEIGSGEISNYLVKPISYVWYWFTRDLANKVLNLGFAFFEFFLLWTVIRPDLHLRLSPEQFLGFVVSIIAAVFIYFFLNLSTRFVSFWSPENTWGLSFFVIILIETLSGLIFPLDLLPDWAFSLVQFTPFPYLVYFPISIILGRLTGFPLLFVLLQSFAWGFVLYFLSNLIWKRGMKNYSSEGK
jgi:ABC-2 type transport system permease protein